MATSKPPPVWFKWGDPFPNPLNIKYPYPNPINWQQLNADYDAVIKEKRGEANPLPSLNTLGGNVGSVVSTATSGIAGSIVDALKALLPNGVVRIAEGLLGLSLLYVGANVLIRS